MQHPHHRDTAPVEVENASDALVALMNQGFVQVKPTTPSILSEQE